MVLAAALIAIAAVHIAAAPTLAEEGELDEGYYDDRDEGEYEDTSVGADEWDEYYSQHVASVMWRQRGVVDPVLAAAVKETIGHRSGAAGLDLGCGTGEDALYMATHGFEEVACLDASRKALARAEASARETFNRAGTPTRIDHVQYVAAFLGADAAAPLGTAPAFDLIWVRSVLQHLSSDDLTAVLAYVRSLLRPGGMALFNEYDMCPGEDLSPRVFCGEEAGPPNSRLSSDLLEVLRQVFPACTSRPEHMIGSCGDTVCSQLYMCGARAVRTDANASHALR